MLWMLAEVHCAVIDCDVCQVCGARLAGSNIRIGKPLPASQRLTAMLIVPNKAQRNGKNERRGALGSNSKLCNSLAK